MSCGNFSKVAKFSNLATAQSMDSTWNEFFSALFHILDTYEYNKSNVNLDFPSAAVSFNQLDVTLSALRSVS